MRKFFGSLFCSLLLAIFIIAVFQSRIVYADEEDNIQMIASGDVDGAHWELDNEGTMTFTGEGTVPGHYWKYLGPISDFDISDEAEANSDLYEPDLGHENPWGDYLEQIRKVVIGDGFTVIAGGAFSDCINLSEVSLPEGMEDIHSCAFAGCSSLKNISLPDSVISIGMSAFAGSGLESITISENLTILGDGAFAYCKNLRNVCWNGSPVNVSRGLFYDCSSLESINIPESVTIIKDKAFCNCSSLQQLKLTGSFSMISGEAFNGCTALTEVSILTDCDQVDFGDESYNNFDSVKTIRYYARMTENGYFEDILNHYFSKAEWIPLDESGNPVLTRMNSSDTAKYIPKLLSVAASDTKAVIKWSAVEGASYYNLYYKVGSGSWQKAECGIKENCYTFTGKTGYTYTFTVKAVRNGHYSAHDTKGLTVRLLSKPVLVSAVNGKAGAIIRWNAVKGAQKYYIYRKESGGKWSRVGYTTAQNWTDQNAASGKTYDYTVRAACGTSLSGFYDGASALSILRLANPAITAIVKNTSGRTVKWKKVSGADTYYIYRKTQSGSYSCIGKTSGVSYTDKTAKSNTVYYYTVRARSGSSLSSFNSGTISR